MAAVIARSLAPFQQLAQVSELFRINARLFQNIQREQLMGVAEEPADEMPHLEARRILAVHLREIHVGARRLAVARGWPRPPERRSCRPTIIRGPSRGRARPRSNCCRMWRSWMD